MIEREYGHSDRLFSSPERVRNATINIYNGHVYSHAVGIPRSHNEAVLIGNGRPVMYRINVKLKHVKPSA